MFQASIRMRIIFNIVGSSLLCVILAMLISFFIVRHQNNNLLNQRITADEKAIQDSINQNLERVNQRIEQDKIAVQEKKDQDDKLINQRLEDEQKAAARWIEQSTNVMEYLLKIKVDSLSAIANQIGSDKLYAEHLKQYNRDKEVTFLQAVLGGYKEQDLKELFRAARVNAIPRIVLYDLQGEWYCTVQQAGNEYHLTYAANRSGELFRQAATSETDLSEWVDQNTAPDIPLTLPQAIPDSSGNSLRRFDNLLWIETWAPVNIMVYDIETNTDSPEQVGLVSVAFPMDMAFINTASKLIGMDINVFIDSNLSAGLVDAYDSLESDVVSQIQGTSSYQLFDKSKGITREMNVGGGNYIEGLFPLFGEKKWLGTMSILYSAKEMQDRIDQMLKESTAYITRIQAASESNIQRIQVLSDQNVQKMEKEAQARIEVLKKEAQKSSRRIIIYLTLATIVALLIIIPLTWLLSGNITRPIHNIVGRFKDIAEGEGDLTARLDAARKDEIGELSKWFNTFMENIQVIIKEIADNSNTLNTSATNLSELSNHMSVGAENMSGKSNSVATAAEQMSTNMNSVSAAMEQTTTNVNLVAAAIEEMTSTINEIAQNSEKGSTISSDAVVKVISASERVGELGKDALEINKVTETITEISEQTNLLALNATIEAARAGESGKGFAVVANEIKELARQTADATQEIKTKIDSIQSSSTGTVKEIELITKVIHDVNDIVSSIAASVEEQSATAREIAANINQISTGIQEVNMSVAQSSTVAGEIAGDIGEANQGAGEISNSSAQVNLSADELKNLAENLKVMVGRFKV